MSAVKKKLPEDVSGDLKAHSMPDFLNYFGRDRWIHLWFAEKRTRVVSVVFPPLVRLGLVPDTISYIGIAFLVGVILYFVRDPFVACLFLAGHIICDGLDGAYARHTDKASQSGAFTDLVCDQLGMITVAVMAVFHNLVSPLLGEIYIALYLIVVVFGVLINVMGLGSRITVTSKYFLYAVYGIWAGWEANFFPTLMSVFSPLMAIEVVIGYLRLKRGIRKKFDSAVRFKEGDPYSSKLNYALNVAVPVGVLVAIVIGANTIPLRTAFDKPKQVVQWEEGPAVLSEEDSGEILGLGVRDKTLLVLIRSNDGQMGIRTWPVAGGQSSGYFTLPGYFDPAFSSLPVDGRLLLLGDRTTHLLMGLDIDASLSAGHAVIYLTLPMGHLRVTAMSVTRCKGRPVWLVANYLYTRKTYVINPVRAEEHGRLLSGVESDFTNGGFPAGMTVWDEFVVELDRTPLNSLIYVAPLPRRAREAALTETARTSFQSPCHDALGPVLDGDDLIMLSPTGRLYRLPMRSLMR